MSTMAYTIPSLKEALEEIGSTWEAGKATPLLHPSRVGLRLYFMDRLEDEWQPDVRSASERFVTSGATMCLVGFKGGDTITPPDFAVAGFDRRNGHREAILLAGQLEPATWRRAAEPLQWKSVRGTVATWILDHIERNLQYG